ncbi:ABC transporter ATP-binding protein [Cryptosporangium phraense]|uniref:ABC transporter ATP-binding protein n=1 Tax=Cryptosporangium phraense TaxID=2593070 RepID=A0A545AVV9_9ACTN|nr:ABC transporter ATP-binding protein [Cryptosporangium phraense]TQS45466.1 ABC transporter ATP-binding protein [Cryptosporangium phraense]
MTIVAENLYRFFHAGDDETHALRGVSLSVEAGEFVALVGPSGSGKSTLLQCLAGLDEPDGGVVRLAGERLSRRPEAERARLRAGRVGVLAQSGNLFPHLTVAQNVRLVQRGTRSLSHLAGLGIGHRADAFPEALSGGESVRAGLAVALANDPVILLADEPTGELDATTERQVLDLLHRRAESGTALLIASHSNAVADAADRVLSLEDGELR